MVLTPVLAGTIAAAFFRDASPYAAFALAAAAAAAAGAIATYSLADHRAKSAFMAAWALARGWQAGAGPWLDEATPLLRAGDRRSSANHVWGPLAGGAPATLCHYTYEVKHTSSNSKGGSTTHWEEHPFTVVQAPVDAPAIPYLTLHPRSFGDNDLFDWLDSALTSNRVVELESTELDREFKLEVADDASELAVRLLFEPAFIVWCLDQAASGMLVELESGTLAIALAGHSYDAAELDYLVALAEKVAGRLEDARAAAGTAS
jgi:hypothetical protein